MGTAQGGYGGGGYGSSSGSGLGYGGQPYTGMGQQPAYGMGTGGQYSPQLRQAQTAWQDMYGNQNYAGPGGTGGQQQPLRQPYGMGAQGMGNAYGYGGQQGNPFGTAGMVGPGGAMSGAFNPNPAPLTAQQQANTDAYWRQASQQPSQYNTGQQGNPFAQLLSMMQQPQQQGSTSLAPPVSQPQAPLQAPRPAAPPPPAAPTRANYSPNNPFAGMYTTPQGDAWEQQQRGGAAPVAPTPAAPVPAAPGTDVMRKALAAGVPNQGTNPGYGYGTPGGYQLDTAPSTLDPGSMTGLLAMMGGNVNGRNWQGTAADYATWYQNTYGKQAPGGPTAYWTT